jgi:transitional endoplasmic reticulum ATPase
VAETKQDGRRLQVSHADAQNAGRGVVRLDARLMAELGIEAGQPVEIIGKRRTVAVAATLEQAGAELTVQLDGLQRANAGTCSDDQVEIRPAVAHPAERVVLAPAGEHQRLDGSAGGLRRTLLGRAVVEGDVVTATPGAGAADLPAYGLRELRLKVVETTPDGVVQIGPDTEVELKRLPEAPDGSRPTDVTYDDLGALGQVITQVRELVELPLRHPEVFEQLGVAPPKGVLVHGPVGNGKGRLARAVANESDARFYYLAGPQIMGADPGSADLTLTRTFEDARSCDRAMIFIDEIEVMAPRRGVTVGERERRVAARLAALMDELAAGRSIVVVGVTTRPELLDDALRSRGRFDREICMGPPDQSGRREILGIQTRGMPLGDDVDLDELARISSGFSAADLATLVQEAAMGVVRQYLPALDTKKELPADALTGLIVRRADFLEAVKHVRPSALHEILVQSPKVTWDDVGGLETVRERLVDGVVLPLRSPDAVARLGVKPARGFLLFGPPGNGKTLLAKAAAHDGEAAFIATAASELLWKGAGDQVARLFARARQVAPAVVFIDELDRLAPYAGGDDVATTQRVLNALLSELDGLADTPGVVVIGATSRPSLIDTAMLRAGRFDEVVYVPAPDQAARRRILAVATRPMPLAEDVNLDDLAARTEGYVGADLCDLVRRAGLLALHKSADARRVDADCFEQALKETRPSCTPEMARAYEDIAATLKQEPPRRPGIGFALPGRPSA